MGIFRPLQKLSPPVLLMTAICPYIPASFLIESFHLAVRLRVVSRGQTHADV